MAVNIGELSVLRGRVTVPFERGEVRITSRGRQREAGSINERKQSSVIPSPPDPLTARGQQYVFMVHYLPKVGIIEGPAR